MAEKVIFVGLVELDNAPSWNMLRNCLTLSYVTFGVGRC